MLHKKIKAAYLFLQYYAAGKSLEHSIADADEKQLSNWAAGVVCHFEMP